MKKRNCGVCAFLLAGLMMILCLSGCAEQPEEFTRQELYNQRGERLFLSTIDKYYDEDNQYALQYYGFKEDVDITADIWHYSSLQEAAVYYRAAFPENARAVELEQSLLDGLKYYAEDREGEDEYTVYGLYRTFTPNSNDYNFDLYDDNSCIIRNRIHSYRLTGDRTEYAQTKLTMQYILENGWDTSLNPSTGEEWGGNDQGPASANYYKPICANEIVCTDLLQMCELADSADEREYYLNWAQKYYDFCVDTFRLENNLYGDYVGCERTGNQTVSQGVVALDMYTYHQGAMIEAGVRMYRATGDGKYLEQAMETADAAREYFGRRDVAEGLYQLPFNVYHWFNLLLLRGYIMLAEENAEKYTPYVDEIAKSIDYAYDNYYRDGLLPCNFLQGWIEGYVFDEKMNIMDASAYAQYYFMLAAFYAGTSIV